MIDGETRARCFLMMRTRVGEYLPSVVRFLGNSQ